MGIIDTISAGFRLVTRRLWLLALPIALDLFLLFGPKLSALPVITQLIDEQIAAQSALQGGSTEIGSAEMIASLDELANDVLGRVNLFGLAAWTRLGFPNTMSSRPVDTATDVVYTITSSGQMVLWQAAILVLGLLFTTAFLVQVAQAIRENHAEPAALVKHTIHSWLRLLALFVPLGVGLVFGMTFLAMMPMGAGLLVLMALMVAAVWAAIYLAFVPHAITLAYESPLGAVNSSFGLVRHNLPQCVGMLALVVLLRTGFGFIWGRMAMVSQWAALAAIVGCAYIGTSLTAALFLFYRDRLAQLRQQQRTLRSLNL
ncbi:MAG: hypothetical protein GXY68_06140 [Chloroflexi bacterium]|nr:hypothetical protein [Chloroflexota bacterium]